MTTIERTEIKELSAKVDDLTGVVGEIDKKLAVLIEGTNLRIENIDRRLCPLEKTAEGSTRFEGRMSGMGMLSVTLISVFSLVIVLLDKLHVF